MEFQIKDCNGQIISIGDIVKLEKRWKEDTQVIKTVYYLYSEDQAHSQYLLLYDDTGNIDFKSFNNIHIDSGVAL